ncbi:MAG TPA: hypothetical protein VF507_10475 [Pyrinomonadaceae bacterium]|jgi:hypothetical protein
MRVTGKLIFIVTALIIIALIIASCASRREARTNNGSAVNSNAPVERSLPPLAARPLSAEMKKVRARVVPRVSSLRELPFKNEVGMAELSGWDYGTRTREMAETLGGDELRTLSKLAAAGGVLPEGTDLATLAASFAAVSAGAAYSPLDKQILLVGKFKGSESFLAHEFVHALQDQHYDLMKMLVVRPYDFDRTEAVFAVVEGDAVNVQHRFEEGDSYGRKSLDDVARQEAARFGDYRKEVGQFFPPLLTETFIFRYRDGARFVEAVRRKGGEPGVNGLFARPPASSEQVLHPEKYFAGEAPRDVRLSEQAFGAKGWRPVVSTPLGEIGVRGLLMAGVSEQTAARAAAGWGGDRAYLFDGANGAPLFVWKTSWDRPVDAEEFYAAYNELQRHRKAAPVGNASDGGTRQALWREGKRVTLVRLEGDQVIVIRGAERDVQAALEAARL